jgi:hypothetical protein
MELKINVDVQRVEIHMLDEKNHRLDRKLDYAIELMHEVLSATVLDPAKLAEITAKMEASRKALLSANQAAQPIST